MKLNKKIKAFDLLDWRFLKWGYITFTLFLVTVWPGFRNVVLSVPWYVWLVLAILFMIRSLKHYFGK